MVEGVVQLRLQGAEEVGEGGATKVDDDDGGGDGDGLEDADDEVDRRWPSPFHRLILRAHTHEDDHQ